MPGAASELLFMKELFGIDLEEFVRRNAQPMLGIHVCEGNTWNFPIAVPLFHCLKSIGKTERLSVYLRCLGGGTETAWQIASLLRWYADEVRIIVPDFAASSATHVAISGDSIQMGPLSALTPVDPQRQHPQLPKDAKGNAVPVSVQELIECMDFISQRIPNDGAQSEWATVISTLFEHVPPLVIGAVMQTSELSRRITRKCLGLRKSPHKNPEAVVDSLSSGFFSHNYRIGRDEARDELGLPVEEFNPDEWYPAMELCAQMDRAFAQPVPKDRLAGIPTAATAVRIKAAVWSARLLRVECLYLDTDGKALGQGWHAPTSAQ